MTRPSTSCGNKTQASAPPTCRLPWALYLFKEIRQFCHSEPSVLPSPALSPHRLLEVQHHHRRMLYVELCHMYTIGLVHIQVLTLAVYSICLLHKNDHKSMSTPCLDTCCVMMIHNITFIFGLQVPLYACRLKIHKKPISENFTESLFFADSGP